MEDEERTGTDITDIVQWTILVGLLAGWIFGASAVVDTVIARVGAAVACAPVTLTLHHPKDWPGAPGWTRGTATEGDGIWPGNPQ